MGNDLQQHNENVKSDVSKKIKKIFQEMEEVCKQKKIDFTIDKQVITRKYYFRKNKRN